MKHGLFLILIWIAFTTTVLWKEINCTEVSRTDTTRTKSRTDLCGSSSKRRFGDETRANVYYFCNQNKDNGKWTMYSFTCPKNTFFNDHLEKCSRIDFPPFPTTVAAPREKEPQIGYTTTKPFVIHSWSESLQEIQNLINKNYHLSRSSTTKATSTTTTSPTTTTMRKPTSVTKAPAKSALSDDPWKAFFLDGLALSAANPISYGGSSLISIAEDEIASLSSTTPPNLQKTKINSLSSVEVSTENLKATTASTSTTVPLSKQDELVVRDFIIKNTKPLIPFPGSGSDNYIWSQSQTLASTNTLTQPLRLPFQLLVPHQLPSAGKGKPKLKVKLPMPKPTNGFSVQLLERFGVKLIPEDQFFFKRKPTFQNFTSTVFSSPEESTPYDASLIQGNPLNLPNHLQPQPLPSLWFPNRESSRDHNKESSAKANNFNVPKSVSRKPRVN